jgi:hypothetical protein
MKLAHVLFLSLTFGVSYFFSTQGKAAEVVWTLSDVQFQGGGTAVGTFTTNDSIPLVPLDPNTDVRFVNSAHIVVSGMSDSFLNQVYDIPSNTAAPAYFYQHYGEISYNWFTFGAFTQGNEGGYIAEKFISFNSQQRL